MKNSRRKTEQWFRNLTNSLQPAGMFKFKPEQVRMLADGEVRASQPYLNRMMAKGIIVGPFPSEAEARAYGQSEPEPEPGLFLRVTADAARLRGMDEDGVSFDEAQEPGENLVLQSALAAVEQHEQELAAAALAEAATPPAPKFEPVPAEVAEAPVEPVVTPAPASVEPEPAPAPEVAPPAPEPVAPVVDATPPAPEPVVEPVVVETPTAPPVANALDAGDDDDGLAAALASPSPTTSKKKK